jgi:hypothetical protein
MAVVLAQWIADWYFGGGKDLSHSNFSLDVLLEVAVVSQEGQYFPEVGCAFDIQRLLPHLLVIAIKHDVFDKFFSDVKLRVDPLVLQQLSSNRYIGLFGHQIAQINEQCKLLVALVRIQFVPDTFDIFDDFSGQLSNSVDVGLLEDLFVLHLVVNKRGHDLVHVFSNLEDGHVQLDVFEASGALVDLPHQL